MSSCTFWLSLLLSCELAGEPAKIITSKIAKYLKKLAFIIELLKTKELRITNLITVTQKDG
jgi:hypothetical protein